MIELSSPETRRELWETFLKILRIGMDYETYKIIVQDWQDQENCEKEVQTDRSDPPLAMA